MNLHVPQMGIPDGFFQLLTIKIPGAGPCAEHGIPEAWVNLGHCYHYGKGVVRDCREAVKLYRKGARMDNALAFYNLGVCYDRGEGVRQSDEKAVYWYKRAAELGVVKAQCNLGVCLINGIGCEGNAKEAVAWFRKAARRGDEKAMFNLWECYRDGEKIWDAVRTVTAFHDAHRDVCAETQLETNPQEMF